MAAPGCSMSRPSRMGALAARVTGIQAQPTIARPANRALMIMGGVIGVGWAFLVQLLQGIHSNFFKARRLPEELLQSHSHEPRGNGSKGNALQRIDPA